MGSFHLSQRRVAELDWRKSSVAVAIDRLRGLSSHSRFGLANPI